MSADGVSATDMADDVFMPSQYAQKTPDGWRAGQASKKYGPGQFVPESYARKVRRMARRELLVNNIEQEVDVGEDEARERAREYLDREDDLKARDDLSDREIQERMGQLRRNLLYGG